MANPKPKRKFTSQTAKAARAKVARPGPEPGGKPKMSEARKLLVELQARTPAALQALDVLLEKRDPVALRMVVNTCLPPTLAEKMTDESAAAEIRNLVEENAELRRLLAEATGMPLKAASG